MSNAPQPRRFLAATHDVKEAWSRALIDEFGPGGLIAEQAPDFNREHLLWALVQLRHVNGRDGVTFVGDAKVAEMLGYNTKDIPGKKTRDVLTRLGYFTQQGKQGRAARLRLSFPVTLEGKYESLADAGIGDVVAVADTKPSKPRKAAKKDEPAPTSPDNEPGPSPLPLAEDGRCEVHADGECPDPDDPFGDTAPWDRTNCRRYRLSSTW